VWTKKPMLVQNSSRKGKNRGRTGEGTKLRVGETGKSPKEKKSFRGGAKYFRSKRKKTWVRPGRQGAGRIGVGGSETTGGKLWGGWR